MCTRSAPGAAFLCLIEEAAALEEACTLLGRDLHVARRQQEDLVGDAAGAAARRDPAHVRALRIRPLEVLVGDVAVLVPVLVLLGDAEVDERAVPDVAQPHPAA